MTKRTLRWETVNKSNTPLSRIADLYFTTCQIEGKTAKTLRGYREKLGRFPIARSRSRWASPPPAPPSAPAPTLSSRQNYPDG